MSCPETFRDLAICLSSSLVRYLRRNHTEMAATTPMDWKGAGHGSSANPDSVLGFDMDMAMVI